MQRPREPTRRGQRGQGAASACQEGLGLILAAGWGTAVTGRRASLGAEPQSIPRAGGEQPRGSGGSSAARPEDGTVFGKRRGFSVQAQRGHREPKPLSRFQFLFLFFYFAIRTQTSRAICGLNHSLNVTFF